MPQFEFFGNLKVYGNCKKCKSRIENRLQNVNGIYSASWDQQSQILGVHYEHALITMNEIIQILLSIGHDTEAYKADQSTYESLPKTCHYRIINT